MVCRLCFPIHRCPLPVAQNKFVQIWCKPGEPGAPCEVTKPVKEWRRLQIFIVASGFVSLPHKALIPQFRPLFLHRERQILVVNESYFRLQPPLFCRSGVALLSLLLMVIVRPRATLTTGLFGLVKGAVCPVPPRWNDSLRYCFPNFGIKIKTMLQGNQEPAHQNS